MPENGVDVRGGWWGAQREQPDAFRIPLKAPARRPVEDLWHYFHPGRVDRRLAPDWFRSRLHTDLDERLEVVWHPIHERWTVWCRNERIRHPLCAGWQFLFPWEGPHTHCYLPLDERLLANIWNCSCRRFDNNGRLYWDRIEAEILRDKQKKEADRQDEVRTKAREWFDHRQIQVSGYGKSNGSKFSESHA